MENLKQIVVNPYVPEAFITLRDGVVRRFAWTLNAVVMYEQVGGMALTLKDGPGNFLRMLLYAALQPTADEREKWTLEYVGNLVPLEEAARLLSQVQEIKKIAERGPGESLASGSVSGVAKRRSRSTSSRR
jgi:hypothetical protein